MRLGCFSTPVTLSKPLARIILIPLAAPVESEADLEIYAVKASWAVRQMRDADNDFNMIILDACRNNPFEGAFRSVDGGLTRMQAPSGSLVAYSAAPGQVAYDGEGANSAYSAALATTMGLPGLKVEDVFKRVRVAVEAATNGSQTPWEESSLRGDFYFNAVGLAGYRGQPRQAQNKRLRQPTRRSSSGIRSKTAAIRRCSKRTSHAFPRASFAGWLN